MFELAKTEIFNKAKRSLFPNSIIDKVKDMVKDWGTEKRLALLSDKTVKDVQAFAFASRQQNSKTPLNFSAHGS